jgi:hypothetical protein
MNFSSAVHGSSWYVFAGQSGTASSNDIFEFNFGTKPQSLISLSEKRTWTRIETTGTAPEKRFGHTMVSFKGNFFVFGGSAKDSLSKLLYCFDVGTPTQHQNNNFFLTNIRQQTMESMASNW